MKRRAIFHLFMLTMSSLTGCWEKDEFKEVDVISFAPQAKEVVTRADFIESSHDLDHFIVWGNYDGNAVFTSQDVTKVEGKWEYEPLQRWIYAAKEYDFSAYTPDGAGTPVIVNNRLSAIDIDCKSTQMDLVMAYTTVPQAEIGNSVMMTFNPVLAAVSFSFRLKEGYTYYNTYRITKVGWKDILTAGRFTLNKDNTIIPPATGDTGEMTVINQFTGETFTTSSAMETDYQFVIPQKTQATLSFTLEINGTEKSYTENVSIDWQSGRKYTYNIVIDPYEITIETTPWKEPIVDNIEIEVPNLNQGNV